MCKVIRCPKEKVTDFAWCEDQIIIIIITAAAAAAVIIAIHYKGV